MIKIGALYLLLLASMAFPPLLLLSLPLLFLYCRSIVRRRRAILNAVDDYQAQELQKDILRVFR